MSKAGMYRLGAEGKSKRETENHWPKCPDIQRRTFPLFEHVQKALRVYFPVYKNLRNSSSIFIFFLKCPKSYFIVPKFIRTCALLFLFF
jgi:hypothetical protein